MNISIANNYFLVKSRIDKRKNQEAAYNIRVYANNVVDEFIEKTNLGLDARPPEQMIKANLSILNKPAVYSNYQRLINSPYFDNNALNRLIVKNQANKNLNHIVELELERMVKNLDFVENNMKHFDIPTKEYKDTVKKQPNPSYADRRKIMKEVQKRKLDASQQFGINIPDYTFSYRNIDVLAESLLRESQMTSSYEKALLVNRMAEAQGLPPVYTKKKWIWTGRGKTTRHESNNMQERDLEEYFTVINDKTLDIDQMLYPCDPNGGPSNSYICYCECEYYGDGSEYLGGVSGLTPQNTENLPNNLNFSSHLNVDLDAPIKTDIESAQFKPLEFNEETQKYKMTVDGVTYESDKQLEIEDIEEVHGLERQQIISQKSLDLDYTEIEAIETNITWDCEFISAFDRHPDDIDDYFIDKISREWCGMTGDDWMPDDILQQKLLITKIEYESYNKKLHNAISKSDGIIENSIVFRGGRMSPDAKKGDRGTFVGFTSTSFQEGAAGLYSMDMMTGNQIPGRYDIKVLIPAKTKCLALNGNNGWYNPEPMREVHELLLNKNFDYDIIEINHKEQTAIVKLL